MRRRTMLDDDFEQAMKIITEPSAKRVVSETRKLMLPRTGKEEDGALWFAILIREAIEKGRLKVTSET